MLFKLHELSLGNFAVCEANENTSQYPIKIHGFITVIQTQPNSSYYVYINKDCSNELKLSGEIEALKKTAVSITEEAVADELGY